MNKNVLLVDDDRICNFITETTLNKLGVAKEVHSALNGQEALDLLNSYFLGDVSIPDIIFLDLNMPIMDGFQFIDAFKKLDFPKKESILIVVLTSSINPNDLEKAKQMGIDHYMTKPVSEEKVLALLKS